MTGCPNAVPLGDVLRHVDLALDGMLAVAEQLGDEQVNARPDLPGANSVFGIVTHCCGVMEYWGGAEIAGREVVRDRASEFRAEGTVAQLVERVAAQREQLLADLGTFNGADMARMIRDRAGFTDSAREAVRTHGGVLMHLYEELAQHRGQVDLTADVLQAQAD